MAPVVWLGWRNLAFLAVMLVLGGLVLAGADRGFPVAFLGGLAALLHLIISIAALASAMARSRPIAPAATGIALALVGGMVLMELMLARLP
ncbi:MAG TPA: hypothetical protein VD970_08030 [Acetobacteraceae bacterium]|nr:hypothetical protein [Acetobacteraceae bacterium]